MAAGRHDRSERRPLQCWLCTPESQSAIRPTCGSLLSPFATAAAGTSFQLPSPSARRAVAGNSSWTPIVRIASDLLPNVTGCQVSAARIWIMHDVQRGHLACKASRFDEAAILARCSRVRPSSTNASSIAGSSKNVDHASPGAAACNMAWRASHYVWHSVTAKLPVTL